MYSQVTLVLSVWAAVSLARQDYQRDEHPYNFLLRNIRELQNEVGSLRKEIRTEVGSLRKEIQHLLHGGNTDQEYNRLVSEHDGRDLQSAYANQESGVDDDSNEYSHNSRSQSNQQPSHNLERHCRGGHHDDLVKAFCDLRPNKDMPTSNVRGTIMISQCKDGKGPVFFDLDLEGFNVERDGYLHGFHIHAQPVTEDYQCGAAKGHFNPFNVDHGGQKAHTRHVGDLGNIRVDEDGKLGSFSFSDDQVYMFGDNSIIGKSIVVHAGEDDLGLGGAPDSLTTGHAGARLACCNIYMQTQSRFSVKSSGIPDYL